MTDYFDGPTEAGEDPDYEFGEDINSRGENIIKQRREKRKKEEEAKTSGGRIEGPDPSEAFNGEGFGFEVVGVEADINFSPEYYPKRWNVSKDTDTESQADSCVGENISVNKVNNARIHAKGDFLTSKIGKMHSLFNHRGDKVEVVNPILPGGGMECILKTVQYGEFVGWDPQKKSWILSYTLDFTSTGKDDESSTEGKQGVVSE